MKAYIPYICNKCGSPFGKDREALRRHTRSKNCPGIRSAGRPPKPIPFSVQYLHQRQPSQLIEMLPKADSQLFDNICLAYLVRTGENLATWQSKQMRSYLAKMREDYFHHPAEDPITPAQKSIAALRRNFRSQMMRRPTYANEINHFQLTQEQIESLYKIYDAIPDYGRTVKDITLQLAKERAQQIRNDRQQEQLLEKYQVKIQNQVPLQPPQLEESQHIQFQQMSPIIQNEIYEQVNRLQYPNAPSQVKYNMPDPPRYSPLVFASQQDLFNRDTRFPNGFEPLDPLLCDVQNTEIDFIKADADNLRSAWTSQLNMRRNDNTLIREFLGSPQQILQIQQQTAAQYIKCQANDRLAKIIQDVSKLKTHTQRKRMLAGILLTTLDNPILWKQLNEIYSNYDARMTLPRVMRYCTKCAQIRVKILITLDTRHPFCVRPIFMQRNAQSVEAISYKMFFEDQMLKMTHMYPRVNHHETLERVMKKWDKMDQIAKLAYVSDKQSMINISQAKIDHHAQLYRKQFTERPNNLLDMDEYNFFGFRKKRVACILFKAFTMIDCPCIRQLYRQRINELME